MKRLTGGENILGGGVRVGTTPWGTLLQLRLRRTKVLGVEESVNYAFCDMQTGSALTFLTDINQTLLSFTGLSFKISFHPSIQLSI